MCAARPSLDEVSTINADGSRRFLHPADARGKWTLARRLVALLLIAIYAGLPWIRIGGQPAVFLDLATRQFHLFGKTLFAADAWLLFFPVTGLGFALFFVTAVCGRLWCGWACPQTVFLEHVFRRIERWLEGDAPARRQLDAAAWTSRKIFLRIAKHTLFLAAAAAVTHVLLAYFVSWPAIYGMVLESPTKHWGVFLFVAAVTGALYFNFAWFREQLCIVLCPYGRLQSALLDENSIVVGYDARRGEPRGRAAHPGARQQGAGSVELGGRNTKPVSASPTSSSDLYAPRPTLPAAINTVPAGDCVDCFRCVHVCPTGIDIRQGLQMECLGCTACIDACDDVMLRLRRAPGLIRHASNAQFSGGRTRWWRPRTMLYGALLLIGATIAAFALASVRPAAMSVLRLPGGTYVIEGEEVRNQFLVRVGNKADATHAFRLETTELPGGVTIAGASEPFDVPAMGEAMRVLVLRVPRSAYRGGFVFRVQLRPAEQGGGTIVESTVDFRGPDPRAWGAAGGGNL